MLASNFRFSTEDVDIAELGRPWPDWLSDVVARIASQNGWSDDWFNDAVTLSLEPARAQPIETSCSWGTFPRAATRRGPDGVRADGAIYAGSEAQGASRVEFRQGNEGPRRRRAACCEFLTSPTLSEAIAILPKFFPNSAADADKAAICAKAHPVHGSSPAMRPATLAEAYERIIAGDAAAKRRCRNFSTLSISRQLPEARLDTLARRAAADRRRAARCAGGAVAEYLARQYRLPSDPGMGVRACALSRSRLAHVAVRRARPCANI